MQSASQEELTESRSASVNVVLLFAPTIFLSAFLLFCCEPMVGKMMLPYLGGSASVWITCLLFFQLMLLAGYGYAHILERYADIRTQIAVHIFLMLMVLLFLPIRFNARPGEMATAYPALWLLGVLLRSVGIPFCIVSTTAPLLQNWLAKTRTSAGRDPYFLYAVSNAGSLMALLAYPLLIEPRWGIRIQSSYWFAGYAALVLLVFSGAALVWANERSECKRESAQPSTHVGGAAGAGAPKVRRERARWSDRLFWLAAAFVPSGLMLAVTNHMLLNLASMPFLWVMPLAIYLITFMIAFARRLRIPPRVLSFTVPIVLLVFFPLVAVSNPIAGHSLKWVLGSHLLVLFAGALLCHTALAEKRPGTDQLTEFYFWVACGGALGGVFVAVVAPFVFSTVIEYPLLVAIIAFFRETRENDRKLRWADWAYPVMVGLLVAGTWSLFRWAKVDVEEDLATSLGADAVLVLVAFLAQRHRVRFALALAVLIAGYHLALPGFLNDYETLRVDRDFFGIKKVVFDRDTNMRKLLHGDTLHGQESMDPMLSGKPLSYYHETGPVGDIMKLISTRPDQHVAVVGLGTGSMAGWAAPNRRITFFDIDPQVPEIANGYFTFLRRCGNGCNIVIGDGRLSIEKAPDGEFDVLMLDAFNSDSIPAHLVSREAVQLYLKKLKQDGLILFHVSNRYMDVEALASAVTLDSGLQGMVRYDDDEEARGKARSDYVVAARHSEDFGSLQDDMNWSAVEKPAGVQPWTDDYSNLLSIVRWR
jgi:SAM-dependent methyltransferase